MQMPPLETERLIIRPFELGDLDEIHQILDLDLKDDWPRHERANWLQWTVLNYEQLAKLHQPPFGDRAMVLKSANRLIGACGLAPCLMPFELLPSFHPQADDSPITGHYTSEIGLYYALSMVYWGQGYATEAAAALIDYAFSQLNLKRILATTTSENLHSMRVMQRLGMRIDQNPYPAPPWFQVVGILENKSPGL
jgi:RimJ/RimL family protein N-acetyltransferase